MKKLILVGIGIFATFGSIAQNNQTYKVGYIETGTISYYPSDEGKRKTESGDEYDMTAMEAAHRYLPMGTLLKVVNLENNKEVFLRVNDRPNTTERIMDVTLAAADSLGMVKSDKAVLLVRSEIMALGVQRTKNLRGVLATAPSPTKNKVEKEKTEKEKTEKVEKTMAKPTTKEAKTPVKSTQDTPKQDEKNTKAVAKNQEKAKEAKTTPPTPTKENKVVAAAPKTTEKTQEKSTPAPKEDNKFGAVGFYNATGAKQTPNGFGVQTGLFTELDRAIAEVKVLEGLKLGKVFVQTIEKDSKKTYKVTVGTFKTKEEAKDVVAKLKEKNYQPFTKKYGE